MNLNVPPNPCPKPERRDKSHKLTTLHSVRYNSLERTSPLKAVGKRGKRLAKEDKRMQEYFRHRECICGCGCTDCQWSHLDGRSDEVRHDPVRAVPCCDVIHPAWLDHHPDGVKCRAEMLERALVKGDTLVHEDVEDLLIRYHYDLYYANEMERRRI